MLESGHFEYNNLMCRMISGYGPRAVVQGKLLSQSMSNIDEHFQFVGVLEKDGASASLESLGLAHAPVPKLNTSADVDEARALFEQLADKIAAHNQEDAALYEIILQRSS